jgi:hypothetical protein
LERRRTAIRAGQSQSSCANLHAPIFMRRSFRGFSFQ